MVRRLVRHRLALAAAALIAAAPGGAAADTRDEEIAECRPGDIATWGDGTDRPAIAPSIRFLYLHAGAPAWFERRTVATMVSRAAAGWSACGLRLTAEAAIEAAALPDGPGEATVIVRWNESAARGNVGLADLGARTLSLGPSSFKLLRERNPGHDASQTLQMTIAHEMGHFLGLMAHSRRCVDVLSYYHDGRGGRCASRDPAGVARHAEYRHVLPTACDIARCRAANGR